MIGKIKTGSIAKKKISVVGFGRNNLHLLRLKTMMTLFVDHFTVDAFHF